MLERYGRIAQPQRIVEGVAAAGEVSVVGLQRVLQAVSDPFLGHLRERAGLLRSAFHHMKGLVEPHRAFLSMPSALTSTRAPCSSRAHRAESERRPGGGYAGRSDAAPRRSSRGVRLRPQSPPTSSTCARRLSLVVALDPRRPSVVAWHAWSFNHLPRPGRLHIGAARRLLPVVLRNRSTTRNTASSPSIPGGGDLSTLGKQTHVARRATPALKFEVADITPPSTIDGQGRSRAPLRRHGHRTSAARPPPNPRRRTEIAWFADPSGNVIAVTRDEAGESVWDAPCPRGGAVRP